MTLIRKQLSLTPEENEMLKELARQWRCSESEVVRRVLRATPADDTWTRRLKQEGVLLSRTGTALPRKERLKLERSIAERRASGIPTPSLSDAILAEREEEYASADGQLRDHETVSRRARQQHGPAPVR